jgi:hypothetical protein
MKIDVKSEMHNLGYRPPLHISTVTSHSFADSILGKISEASLNIPASVEYDRLVHICVCKTVQ